MKKLVLGFVLILLALIVPIICIVKGVHFKQDCSGYLKQVADAGTIQLALDRVNKALDYIESNNLTDGYTSVLWRTEDENIGFWYENIKACKGELEKGLDGTQLEQTNILMKVRETLTDNGKLTIPEGIHKYPNNGLFFILNTISILLLLVGIVLVDMG